MRPRRRPMPVAAAAVAVAVLLPVATYTHAGRLATAYVFVVLHYYIGVVALVALSLTVMAGLASTDRLVLRIGQRVLLQTAHRATAIVAIVALGVHIAVKVLEAPVPDGTADGGAGRLSVDWSSCAGHGLCAHVLPELIRLDENGFPTIPTPRCRRGWRPRPAAPPTCAPRSPCGSAAPPATTPRAPIARHRGGGRSPAADAGRRRRAPGDHR
ncbi:ferredoxin [Dactylosporangium sp. NPDC049140]|uniref:ferredoxin n=1 Tax=Dactylosporangium sp. NPDC049140 TaxID=3155647 RepID=UPI0033E7F8BE